MKRSCAGTTAATIEECALQINTNVAIWWPICCALSLEASSRVGAVYAAMIRIDPFLSDHFLIDTLDRINHRLSTAGPLDLLGSNLLYLTQSRVSGFCIHSRWDPHGKSVGHREMMTWITWLPKMVRRDVCDIISKHNFFSREWMYYVIFISSVYVGIHAIVTCYYCQILSPMSGPARLNYGSSDTMSLQRSHHYMIHKALHF